MESRGLWIELKAKREGSTACLGVSQPPWQKKSLCLKDAQISCLECKKHNMLKVKISLRVPIKDDDIG